MKKLAYITICIFLICCSEEQEPLNYSSSKYSECNDLLSHCNSTGDYCLFGFKWGEGNNFTTIGVNVDGPQMPGGMISFSFQETPTTVSNHREVDVPTESFDQLPDCAREKIRLAFNEWSNAANIQFEEKPDDSDTDIKIFVARVGTKGNGFPNYSNTICQQLSGHVILSPEYTSDCNVFYPYVLHEIGHSLGLGHSSSDNLMGSINSNLDGLKAGDIEGIRQIYGE